VAQLFSLGIAAARQKHMTIGAMIIEKPPSKISVTPVTWIPMSSKIAPVIQRAIPQMIIFSVVFILFVCC
jgi:hypothetical protein